MLEEGSALGMMWRRFGTQAASAEGLAPAEVESALSRGTMVLLGNPGHAGVRPTLVGQPAAIKVNANIGTSPLINDPAIEMHKLREAARAGAHTVMDLSTAGDLDAIRRGMLAECRCPSAPCPSTRWPSAT
jgi:phosphomethylpyrimidine synthase